MFTMMITKHYRMCVQLAVCKCRRSRGSLNELFVSLCYIVSPSQGVADLSVSRLVALQSG